MSLADRRTPEETRAKILEVAWDLFRQLGLRTTVAEIADKLGMSSANVYRFFPSKQALSEAVCASVLARLVALARSIATNPAPAAERLSEILLTMFHAMREEMVGASRVYEIVETAISERWPAVDDYERAIVGVLAELVAEGQSRGEFGPGDPRELGHLTLCACVGIHHPVLIALYGAPDADPPPERIVTFALRALANLQPGNGA